jgi:hypothetical protein
MSRLRRTQLVRKFVFMGVDPEKVARRYDVWS